MVVVELWTISNCNESYVKQSGWKMNKINKFQFTIPKTSISAIPIFHINFYYDFKDHQVVNTWDAIIVKQRWLCCKCTRKNLSARFPHDSWASTAARNLICILSLLRSSLKIWFGLHHRGNTIFSFSTRNIVLYNY